MIMGVFYCDAAGLFKAMWKKQPSDDQDMMQIFWPICTEMSGDST